MFLFFRNLLYKNRISINKHNDIKLGSRVLGVMKKTTIKVTGDNNQLIIDNGANITNCQIRISGSNNKIHIGENVRFKSGKILLNYTEGQVISIGPETTVEGALLLVDEAASIYIGKDCMLSTDIIIRTGDKHSILDSKTKQRLNYAKDVVLEDRVWLGRSVQVLKGSLLKTETVVGARSLVTKKFSQGNCIVAGMPARVIKENVCWDRDTL